MKDSNIDYRFIIGLSGGAFNFWEIELESNGTLASFSKSKRSVQPSAGLLEKRMIAIPLSEANDIIDAFEGFYNLSRSQVTPLITSAQVPNPFFGVASSSAETQTASDLSLVDGSENGQTIPFWGQIQPARNPSFIIGWDDDIDAAPYNWNNGTNLYHT